MSDGPPLELKPKISTEEFKGGLAEMARCIRILGSGIQVDRSHDGRLG